MNRKLKTLAFVALVMAGGLMLTACTPNPAELRKRPFFCFVKANKQKQIGKACLNNIIYMGTM